MLLQSRLRGRRYVCSYQQLLRFWANDVSFKTSHERSLFLSLIPEIVTNRLIRACLAAAFLPPFGFSGYQLLPGVTLVIPIIQEFKTAKHTGFYQLRLPSKPSKLRFEGIFQKLLGRYFSKNLPPFDYVTSANLYKNTKINSYCNNNNIHLISHDG